MKAVVSSDQEGMAAFLQTGFLLSGEKSEYSMPFKHRTAGQIKH